MKHRIPRESAGRPVKPGFLRRAFRAIRFGVGMLVLLVLALYGTACRFGLPGWIRERVEAVALDQGFDLRIQEIRPSWPGTFRFENVQVSPDRSAVQARIREVRVRLDLRDLFHGRVTVVELALEEGELSVPLVKDGSSESVEPFRVALQSGAIRKSGSHVELDLNARIFDGFTIRVTGAPDLAGWKPSTSRVPPGKIANDWADRSVSALRKIREVARNVEWGERAGVLLVVSGGPELPEGLCVDARAEGRNGFAYGVSLEDWSARAEYRGGCVDPLVVRVACAGDEMRLQGRVDPTARRLDLNVDGTWNSASLLRRIRSWIPDESARPPDSLLRGSTRLEIRTGDVAWTNATAGLYARIRIGEPAEFYGVPFSRLDLEVRKDGSRIRVNVAELDLGWIAGSSRITGEGAYCLATREFEGKASGTADPVAVLSLMTPSEAYLFGNLRFLGEAPRLSAQFHGSLDDLSRFELTGRVDGRDFVYQGTSVDEAGFDLDVREESVRFSRLVVKRPEGELTGSVTLLLRDGRVAFEAESRLEPGAVARIIGPTSHRFIRQFRFEGPVTVSGAGTLGYRGSVSGDVHLEISAQRAGMDWVLADEVACTLVLSGRRLELNGIRGQGFGGTFAGDARIDLSPDGEGKPSYALKGEIVNAEIVRILRDLRPTVQTNPELGLLTLRADMKGEIGEGTGPTVTGTGSCEVKGGRLFSLPLLGGLSKIFSRIMPGLGYLSQSALTVDCRIGDSRIHSDKILLTGPLLSMRARGSLGFDLTLDYLVEAQLLRKGPIAGTVRILTAPLTKLLEFELRGTVQEPSWRAKNFSPDEDLLKTPEPEK